MSEKKTKTELDLFEDWANGIGLDGSKDHHAIYAVKRFRLYQKSMRREKNQEWERD